MCNAETIYGLKYPCRAATFNYVIVFGIIPAFKAKSLILKAFSSRISFNVFTFNIVTLNTHLTMFNNDSIIYIAVMLLL